MSTHDGSPSVAIRNEELFRRILEEGFGHGNTDLVDSVVAPDFIEHQPGVGPGRDGLKGLIQSLHTGFPDLSLTIEDLVVDADKVWGRMRARGTHRGPLMGQPPTGRSMEIDIIDICRFADGQMVEHWGVPDRFSLMAQLGLLPQPPAAPTPGPDTHPTH